MHLPRQTNMDITLPLIKGDGVFSKVTHRAPKHKYTAQMSQVSKFEPLGVFPLDPASNHGEESK